MQHLYFSHDTLTMVEVSPTSSSVKNNPDAMRWENYQESLLPVLYLYLHRECHEKHNLFEPVSLILAIVAFKELYLLTIPKSLHQHRNPYQSHFLLPGVHCATVSEAMAKHILGSSQTTRAPIESHPSTHGTY